MNSDNYIKFGPTEMIVQFGTDRGTWKPRPTPNRADDGYFFRAFSDGRRFACVNSDLERRLIDLGYRAGERVGITRQTRNRAVIWVVRLVDRLETPAIAPAPTLKRTPPPLPVLPIPEAAPVPGQPGAARGYVVKAPPLPANKYAPPPTVWPELEANGNGHAPKKPNGTAAEPAPAKSDYRSGGDGDLMGRCLCEALDACKTGQAHAAVIGHPTLFGPGEIQRIAVSLFIQRVQYGSVVDHTSNSRPNGTTEAWRH